MALRIERRIPSKPAEMMPSVLFRSREVQWFASYSFNRHVPVSGAAQSDGGPRALVLARDETPRCLSQCPPGIRIDRSHRSRSPNKPARYRAEGLAARAG